MAGRTGSAVVGTLAVKIVPDASDFQRETVREVRQTAQQIENILKGVSASIAKTSAKSAAAAATAGTKVGKSYTTGVSQGMSGAGGGAAKAGATITRGAATAAAQAKAAGRKVGKAYADGVKSGTEEQGLMGALAGKEGRKAPTGAEGGKLYAQSQSESREIKKAMKDRLDSVTRAAAVQRQVEEASVDSMWQGLLAQKKIDDQLELDRKARVNAAHDEVLEIARLQDEAAKEDQQRTIRNSILHNQTIAQAQRQAMQDHRKWLADRHAMIQQAHTEALLEDRDRTNRMQQIEAQANAGSKRSAIDRLIFQTQVDKAREEAARRSAAVQDEIDQKQARRSRSRFSQMMSGVMGSTGRAGRDTEGPLQRLMKSFAFIGGGPLKGLSSTLGLVGGQAAVAGGAVAAVGTAIAGTAIAAAALGAGLAAGATAYGNLASAALGAAGGLEQTKVAYQTLLGDAAKGEQMLAKVIQFAKATPFDVESISQGVKQLMAYGFAADDTIPIMKDLGDAAAALGLNSQGMGRLVIALGQVQTKGKFQADEARQFAENGIPVWDILSKKMGVAKSEVMRLSEEGLIPADQAVANIRAGLQELYGGGMQAQSQTFVGTMSRIKEAMNLGLAQGTLNSMKGITAEINQWAPKLSNLSLLLGSEFGQSFASFLGGIGPAVSDLEISLQGFLPRLFDTWTPVYARLTNGLAAAFRNAVPGINVISEAIANIVDNISGRLSGLGDAFSFAMSGIEPLLSAIGPVVANIMNQLTSYLTAVGALFTGLRILWNELVAMVSGAMALLAGVAAQVLDALGMDGAAEKMQGLAKSIGEVAQEAGASSERLKLGPEVNASIKEAEASFLSFATAANKLPAEVKTKFGIDTEGIAQGEAQALQALANLPEEQLTRIGLDRKSLVSEAALALRIIEPLGEEVKTTINADPEKAIAEAGRAEKAMQTMSQGEYLAKIRADNLAAVEARKAQEAINGVRQAEPVPIRAEDLTPEAKQSAMASVNSVVQLQASGINAADLTGPDREAAIASINSVMQYAPAIIAAQDSTQAERDAAQAAINAVVQLRPILIDATDGATPVGSQARRNLEAQASTPIVFTITARPVGQNGAAFDDLRPNARGGAPAPPGEAISPMSGAAISPMSDAAVVPFASASTSNVGNSGSFWLLNLAIVYKIKERGRMIAGAVEEGLRAIYAKEYLVERQIEDQRRAFSKRQQQDAERFSDNLRRNEEGLADGLLKWRQDENRKIEDAFRDQQEREAISYDRRLDDQRRYYDEQKRLADEAISKLGEVQQRMIGTVDWSTTNPATLIRNLRRSSALIEQYGKDYATLRGKGLSQQALDALGGLDPKVAAKLAANLLRNPSMIADLNSAYGGLVSASVIASNAYAPAAASAFGGGGIVINQQITASPGMSTTALAQQVGKELTWQLRA